MLRCKICGEPYEEEDFTDPSEACPNICPECLYSGRSLEDDEQDDIDDRDNELDLIDIFEEGMEEVDPADMTDAYVGGPDGDDEEYTPDDDDENDFGDSDRDNF